MDMREVAVTHFGLFLRHANSIRQYRSLVSSVERPVPRILWLWGPTGAGKSRCLSGLITARCAISSDVTNTPTVYYVSPTSNTGTWWTGYYGQRVVVMDDIRSVAFRHEMWLQLFDQLPMTVPIYGNAVPMTSSWFILTTNDPPHMFFLSGDGSGAFLRRVKDFAWIYWVRKSVVVLESTPNVPS